MAKVVRLPLERRAWRISEWRAELPVGRSQLYEWIKDKTVDSVRIGGSRFILTSPTDFIERHRAPTA